jgi:hypothetical protein
MFPIDGCKRRRLSSKASLATLIGLFALALAPASAAAMDSAGGDAQCQGIGDTFYNEMTGGFEFCDFGGGSGGGGPFEVGAGGGSGAAPIPGTGLPGEVVPVSGTAPPEPKCGDPGVICVPLGVSVAPPAKDGEKPNPPKGNGGPKAEVPNGQPADPEAARQNKCRALFQSVSKARKDFIQLRDKGTLTLRNGEVLRLEGQEREDFLDAIRKTIKDNRAKLNLHSCN